MDSPHKDAKIPLSKVRASFYGEEMNKTWFEMTDDEKEKLEREKKITEESPLVALALKELDRKIGILDTALYNLQLKHKDLAHTIWRMTDDD